MSLSKLLILLLFLIPSKLILSQCCTITLETYDSYGDGWNGGSLEVYINGTLDGTYSAAVYGSTFSISVCDGDVFELVYSSGSYEYENSYELINSNGVVFSDGTSPSTGSVFTDNNMCSLAPTCINTSAFGSATAPTDNNQEQISSCLWQDEYNTLNSVVAGETYTSETDCGGFITIRSGSYNGAVVASGNSPLSWTATTNGTHYIHYNTNSSCGTASTCCYTFITCTSCPDPVLTPQDCEGAIIVCDDNTFNGDAVDYGDLYEIDEFSNTGCGMDSENQSTWFYVNISTSGTLEMTIDPANNTDDYDWSIWGPYTSSTAGANCPPISTPIRCNTSSNGPQTGMNTTASNDEEFPGGTTYEWSNPINATAGDIYIMMIDNWSASGNPFDLNWGGTAGLDCTPVNLPVDLIEFFGTKKDNRNELLWTTKSETNNDYFILEYSSNAENWNEIEKIDGAGTTSQEQTYLTNHREYEKGINYYRLTQVDFDGKRTKHDVISIDNSEKRSLLKRINTMGQEVNEDYNGIVILYYSDGTIEKTFQK